MTITWEKFAGNTDIFAFRLAFMPDPDSGTGATGEEATSWGSFQLWVEGQNLCAHISQGELLQRTHWYLLPLLEWLAEHWNALLHEEKLPNRNVEEAAATALIMTRNAPALAEEAETVAWEEEWYEWHQRHALRAARSGGLIPNIVIRRFRDSIEVSWDDEPISGAPTGFRHSAATGVSYFYPEQVADPLYEVLQAAAEHLMSMNPGSERVATLREKIESLRLPGQHDSRLNWLAGLRTLPPLPGRIQGSLLEDDMRSRWEEIIAALKSSGNNEGAQAALSVEESPLVIAGSCHAALLFSSLSPTVAREDVRTLASVLLEQYSRQATVNSLDELSEHVLPNLTVPAWEQGYELAEIIHADMGDAFPDGWVDVAGLLEQLGVTIVSRKLQDLNIRACSMVGPHHRPTIVHNTTSSFFASRNAQRFSMAHELCHLLFDRSRGQKLAIASGAWAPRSIERRANAFAAMFLMPTRLVQQAIADAPDPITDLEGITAIAARLRVSRRAAIEHLYNLTLMTDFDRDELLSQVQD
ncbi:ImmA/IrrE family metallo-endopeptidase [Sphaerisporangium sp. NPDC049002]|uniref:ImmA/IrrE family metallo-endopeptidase n=1 Tax=Sphaerisporangium sp. NPDC049002 TaxID=3155392 RepID=UPI0033CECA54